MTARSLSSRDLVLLVLLTLFWGVNWPVMKFAVSSYPPLSFRVLSLIGGVASLWAVARVRGMPLALPAGAWREVVRLSLPNMVGWHLFAIYGVKLLSSGRAAILGYTMPVWALAFGVALFGERVSARLWLGAAASALAVLLLVSGDLHALRVSPLGTVLMLIAAASWGYGTHLMRRQTLGLPTLVLTLWMMVTTTLLLLPVAVVLEAPQWRWPGPGEWLAIAYNALVVFGFCHVVWFHLARILPPVASGLSVMAIPVLGVFSGMIGLGEVPQWQDYAALALIALAVSTVLLRRRSA